MNGFTAAYAGQIAGTLSGFDRLVLRGTLRQIASPFGLNGYLWASQVLLKDFGAHAQKISETVKSAALDAISSAGRSAISTAVDWTRNSSLHRCPGSDHRRARLRLDLCRTLLRFRCVP